MAAAAVIAIAVLWIWLQIGSLDNDIAQASEHLKQMDPAAKTADDNLKKAAEIEKWIGGDVNWLDEIARLATKVPPAKDLMLTLISTPNDYLKNTSNMHLEGVAHSTNVVEQLPQALRDDQHDVTPRSAVQDDRGRKEYPWQVKTDVRINPAKPASATPAKPRVTGAAGAAATPASGAAAQPQATSAEASTP